MQLIQLAIFSSSPPPLWQRTTQRDLEYPFEDSNDSLRTCETSFTSIPDHLVEPAIAKSPLFASRAKRLATGGGNQVESYDVQSGVLHATDTTLDFISRNALNRNRSFIDHIREIPGFERSRGRLASIPKSPLLSPGTVERRSKYIIGNNSDDDDIEEFSKLAEMSKANIDESYLSLGMSRSWGAVGFC